MRGRAGGRRGSLLDARCWVRTRGSRCEVSDLARRGRTGRWRNPGQTEGFLHCRSKDGAYERLTFPSASSEGCSSSGFSEYRNVVERWRGGATSVTLFRGSSACTASVEGWYWGCVERSIGWPASFSVTWSMFELCLSKMMHELVRVMVGDSDKDIFVLPDLKLTAHGWGIASLGNSITLPTWTQV